MERRNLVFGISLILLISVIYGCKGNPQREAKRIVKEWVGKKVIFPDNVPCYSLNGDGVCPDVDEKSYKVLLYTDSVGCISCKLRLTEWKQIMQEADSLFPGKLMFVFYFHPQREKELIYNFKREGFIYPVFMDKKNEIDDLNKFPSRMEYQCFLLDESNQVQAIGNPTLNPRIWDLYKQYLMDEPVVETNLLTMVEADAEEVVLDGLKVNEDSSCSFVLKNTGENPLIIQTVKTTCGCTVPVWDKQPIQPGSETTIDVQVTPEQSGYFQKTINVFCNVPSESVRLSIKGSVE